MWSCPSGWVAGACPVYSWKFVLHTESPRDYVNLTSFTAHQPAIIGVIWWACWWLTETKKLCNVSSIQWYGSRMRSMANWKFSYHGLKLERTLPQVATKMSSTQCLEVTNICTFLTASLRKCQKAGGDSSLTNVKQLKGKLDTKNDE